jgi:hypothetical protein
LKVIDSAPYACRVLGKIEFLWMEQLSRSRTLQSPGYGFMSGSCV